MSFFQEKKRTIGLSLIVVGLIPQLALTAYIVYIRTPSIPIIVAYLLSWGLFFAGKTMLKTGYTESAQVEAE